MSADSRDSLAFPHIHIPHIPLQILNISGILQESGQMPDHLILILCIHVQVDHPIIQNLQLTNLPMMNAIRRPPKNPAFDWAEQ